MMLIKRIRTLGLLFCIIYISFDSLNDNKFYGNWYLVSNEENHDAIDYFEFHQDGTVNWMNDFFSHEIGNYRVVENNLEIQRNGEDTTFQISFKLDKNDTLILGQNLKYLRDTIKFNFPYPNYSLINFQTNVTLTEKQRTYDAVHYYKNESGKTILGLNAQKVDLKDLSKHLRNSLGNEVLIFLDKRTTIKELKELYFILCIRYKNALIVTKKKGSFDYYVLEDDIGIWWKEMKDELEYKYKMQPPPPPPIQSVDDFLKESGEIIFVRNEKKIAEIEKELNAEKKYVFSIDKEISMIDYLKIKDRISKSKVIQGLEYKTEIR